MTDTAIDVSKMNGECPHCDGTGNIKPDIGDRLLWLRKQVIATQEDLAATIGISRPALANMEAGKQGFTQQNIKLICRHFEVSADWFLGI